VLDMGGTSFHLLVADVYADGRVSRVYRERAGLRLGRWIADGEPVPAKVRKRAADTARRLEARALAAGAERVVAVGTAPFRDAPNALRLAQALERALETPLRVLSAQGEARAILRGLAVCDPAAARRGTLLDLGGGSLIVARTSRAELGPTVGLPLGAVRLRRALRLDDPLGSAGARAVRDRVAKELARIGDLGAKDRPGDRVVATGGSARALLRLELAARPRGAPDGPELPVLSEARLAEWAERLAERSERERKHIRGMRLHRLDILPVAALTLHETLLSLGGTELAICPWGLREGILVETARALR
jgi:exopolyphosphatase / guanosine-5'-triphosphate,3'-diphosphate pyrophosphatase